MSQDKHVLHLRSSVANNFPTADKTVSGTPIMDYGEIAINYAANDEFISIKNSDNALTLFRSWPYIEQVILENELVTAAALTNFKNACGFNDNGEFKPNTGSNYIKHSTNVKEALEQLDTAIMNVNNNLSGYVPAWLLDEILWDKQDRLYAGPGIEINGSTISVNLDTSLYRIVDALPENDYEFNKIYLVKTNTSGDTNIYTEYINVNDKWETIGEYKATIDLADYLNKNTDNYIQRAIIHNLSGDYKYINDELHFSPSGNVIFGYETKQDEDTGENVTMINANVDLSSKQDALTAGDGISIIDGMIKSNAIYILDFNIANGEITISEEEYEKYINAQYVLLKSGTILYEPTVDMRAANGQMILVDINPSTELTMIRLSSYVADNGQRMMLCQTQENKRLGFIYTPTFTPQTSGGTVSQNDYNKINMTDAVLITLSTGEKQLVVPVISDSSITLQYTYARPANEMMNIVQSHTIVINTDRTYTYTVTSRPSPTLSYIQTIIPTTTSQLLNDSGFISKDDLALTYVSDIYQGEYYNSNDGSIATIDFNGIYRTSKFSTLGSFHAKFTFGEEITGGTITAYSWNSNGEYFGSVATSVPSGTTYDWSLQPSEGDAYYAFTIECPITDPGKIRVDITYTYAQQSTVNNLLIDLTKTSTACGLDSNKAFAPASTTHIINNSSNITQALEELDAYVYQLVTEYNYKNSYNYRTSLSSIPLTKRLLLVDVNSDQALTLSSNGSIPEGGDLHILVKNTHSSNNITVAFPTSSEYYKTSGDSLTIKPNSWGEINIIKANGNYYIRSI